MITTITIYMRPNLVDDQWVAQSFNSPVHKRPVLEPIYTRLCDQLLTQ